MKTIHDSILGDLHFDCSWERGYEVNIFGKDIETILQVQTFDNEPISDLQRTAYLNFESRKREIVQNIETAIFEYYVNNSDSFRAALDHDDKNIKAPIIYQPMELGILLDLKAVKLMSSDRREVGFIFNASFDSELGVGVLVVEEMEIEVDVQDFILG